MRTFHRAVILSIAGLVMAAAGRATGDSIFKTDGTAKTPFSDRKAHAVGDVVTVVITESTQATQNAATALQRSLSATASGGSIGGLKDIIPAASLGGSTSNQGSGSTTRSSSLTTTITCRVTAVTQNGLLELTGDRTLKVNTDTQTIRFTGKARGDDIAIDNTLASSYVADAKIEVVGKGSLDQHTRPSIFARIFQFLF